jgi:diguanylate cyclase (GGDEF)-like protein/PAS domain S-box-containing protein
MPRQGPIDAVRPRPRRASGLMVRVLVGEAGIIALVAVVMTTFTAAVRDHQRATRQGAQSAQVLNASQLIERKVIDLETGVRGYADTGQRRFLTPWSEARATLPGELAQLRRLVDDRGQERRVAALQSSVGSYITGYTVPFVARPRPLRGAALIAFTVRGKTLLDALRARFSHFDATEQSLQASRDRRSAATDRKLVVIGAGAGLVIALTIVLFLALVARLIVVPLRRVIAACAAFAAGERDVRAPVTGRGELRELGWAFNEMAERLSARELELQAAARALERERLALDEAQRIAYVGSWWWDTGADEATWSLEMYRIFGREPGRGPATGDEFFAYLHPDDRQRVAAAYDQTFGDQGSFELDYRIVPENGSALTLHALGRRDRDRPGCYAGTVQDVTELRLAELGRRRQRDYAAAITSSMREGFMLMRDGVILEVNDALCELTGFSRAELLGVGVPYPFWAPEAVEEIARERKLIRGERGHEFEATYMRKDGTRFDASITAVAARSADGEPLGYVSTVRDISERKRIEAELQRLATHDPLTGLANYRVLHERLRAEVARATRHRHPLSVAVLDLDHFKDVNDRYGHPTGDRVLFEAAQRLGAVAREGELLARVGGEEFAWILNSEGLDAIAATERARRAISATPFAGVGTVTISIGVCDLQAAGGREHLYQRADQALYWSKRHGRNRSSRYSSEIAYELASSDITA